MPLYCEKANHLLVPEIEKPQAVTMDAHVPLLLTMGDGLSARADTTLVVRCSYCVGGGEFIPMLAHKDGRFVCVWCAHTVRIYDPEYHCTCRRCLEMAKCHLQMLQKNRGWRGRS